MFLHQLHGFARKYRVESKNEMKVHARIWRSHERACQSPTYWWWRWIEFVISVLQGGNEINQRWNSSQLKSFAFTHLHTSELVAWLADFGISWGGVHQVRAKAIQYPTKEMMGGTQIVRKWIKIRGWTSIISFWGDSNSCLLTGCVRHRLPAFRKDIYHFLLVLQRSNKPTTWGFRREYGGSFFHEEEGTMPTNTLHSNLTRGASVSEMKFVLEVEWATMEDTTEKKMMIWVSRFHAECGMSSFWMEFQWIGIRIAKDGWWWWWWRRSISPFHSVTIALTQARIFLRYRGYRRKWPIKRLIALGRQ